jgi:diketogulonate reductase-like aldo/keto reductase
VPSDQPTGGQPAQRPLLAGPLGYGASALVGGRTRREALRLLAAATDAGVRHFDVARVYGTGDAESVVGEFVRGRREQLTITTKFGIHPLRRSPLSSVAKRAVRLATRRSQRLLGAARRHAGHTVSRGDFSPENARASLRTSLRELGVEWVDAYLLHDCTPEDWSEAQLRAVLDELVATGLVRTIGTATSQAATAEMLARGLAAPVAQFDSCTTAPGPVAEMQAAGSLTVTFAPLSGALALLGEQVAGRPEVAASWSRALDVDVASTETLADLLLADALANNPGGVVLFSSGQERRIVRAARIAAERPFGEEQLERFRELAYSAGSRLARGSSSYSG